jgi:hypothetical protein
LAKFKNKTQFQNIKTQFNQNPEEESSKISTLLFEEDPDAEIV